MRRLQHDGQKPRRLAGEGNEDLRLAAIAVESGEAAGEAAAREEVAQLALDEGRHAGVVRAAARVGEELLLQLLREVERRLLLDLARVRCRVGLEAGEVLERRGGRVGCSGEYRRPCPRKKT